VILKTREAKEDAFAPNQLVRMAWVFCDKGLFEEAYSMMIRRVLVNKDSELLIHDPILVNPTC
jgi:hypothetical protein